MNLPPCGQTIHIHTKQGLDVSKKMLTAQDAAGARSQKQERRSGVLQEEGRMPEHDRKATNMQKIRERAAVAKHTQVCQELNDPQRLNTGALVGGQFLIMAMIVS